MKVVMAYWVGGYKNLPAWFVDKGEIDITPEMLMELYATGINVMLYHVGVGDDTILFVDDKRFTMR